MALIAIAPALAFAQVGNFITGNKLYELANSANPQERGVFLGYVMAIHDSNRTRDGFCLPSNEVTSGQLGDVVRKYLGENPSTRHIDADVLVINAFTGSWPCPNSKRN
jgi:hypothetical protein